MKDEDCDLLYWIFFAAILLGVPFLGVLVGAALVGGLLGF